MVAHVLADFCWQGSWVAENKGKYRIVMLAHCIAWAGVLCVPLAIFNVLVWKQVLFLFSGHYMIEQWKAEKFLDKEPTDKQTRIF